MGYRVIQPNDLEWIERPPEVGDAARRVARLSEPAGFQRTRGNMWHFDPGAVGRRHRDRTQEETFVVLAGTLTMYLDDPPERVDVPVGGVVHVEAGTVLQTANHGDEELRVWAYGAPAEDSDVDFLDSAV